MPAWELRNLKELFNSLGYNGFFKFIFLRLQFHHFLPPFRPSKAFLILLAVFKTQDLCFHSLIIVTYNGFLKQQPYLGLVYIYKVLFWKKTIINLNLQFSSCVRLLGVICSIGIWFIKC